MTAFSSADNLETAVRASAAYPSIFLPVKIHNNYFVDGGVANAVPVEIARKMGAEFVIAVDLSEDFTRRDPHKCFGNLKTIFGNQLCSSRKNGNLSGQLYYQHSFTNDWDI